MPGTYVAFSLQSGMAKSWQSTCAKYSHTTMEEIVIKFSDLRLVKSVFDNLTRGKLRKKKENNSKFSERKFKALKGVKF